MIGKFDPQLRIHTANHEITVSGPLRWDAADAGKTVQIKATISQNGTSVDCNDNFTAPNSGATFPFLTFWTMNVDAGGLTPGLAHGTAVAERRGNVEDSWETPDPYAVPAEAPIQIVTTTP